MSSKLFRFMQSIINLFLILIVASCGGGGSNIPAANKDSAAPIIEIIKPTPGTKVATNSFIEITFNEEIKNFDTDNILIRIYKNNIIDPSSAIPLQTSDLSFSGKTLTVKPGILKASKKFQVIIRDFQDTSGNVIEDQCQWDFATDDYTGSVDDISIGNCGNGPGTPDSTPPTVVSVSPVGAAIPKTSSIIITFDEAIDTGTLESNIILSEISGSSITPVLPLPYNIDYYNQTEFKVTLIPNITPALKANTQYQITIKGGSTGVKDIKGNSLLDDNNTLFTTLADSVSDTTPPLVSEITPIIATTVDPTTSLSVIFNKAMDTTTIQANIILSEIVNGSPILVTPLSNLYSYSYDNTQNKANFVIKPGQSLSFQSEYEIRVLTGVKDSSGNSLSADKTSQFSTIQKSDTTAPLVSLVIPAVGNSVALTTNITITFTKAMDETTLKSNIRLTNVNDAAVTPLSNYNYAYNATLKKVTFTPIQSPALNKATTYQLVIKGGVTGVKDSSNNALAADFIRLFTTTTVPSPVPPDTTAPVVNSVIPVEGTTIATTTDIKITFDEAMDTVTFSSNFELYEIVAGTPFLISPLPFTINYDQALFKVTLTPNPSPALFAGKNYRIVVKGGVAGVMNVSGLALATDKITNFSTAIASNQWTWMDGPSAGNVAGDYVLPNVLPGAREDASSWTDPSGNFWLFGGLTVSGGSIQRFNDLWKYDGFNWSYESGTSTVNSAGVYGAVSGIASTAIYPGARSDSATWIDSTGNLWLFGGEGYDSAGVSGALNDLWKYNPGTKKWTWLKGSNLKGDPGSYSNTTGTALSTNIPPSRIGASSWVDNTSNLWLFGGYGNGNTFNDVWKYVSSNNTWIWISGSNTPGQSGIYTDVGAGVSPGSRALSKTWKDAAGNFWLFGGLGYDINGSNNSSPGQELNDIWKFNPNNATWSFITGSTTIKAKGIYGVKGTANVGNTPGARYNGVSWQDSKGNLWLWGGLGYNANGTRTRLTDMWKFDGKNWTWIYGTDSTVQATNYGTKGISTPTTSPGARIGAVAWKDLNGNFWFFGGEYGARKNDLWKYTP